MEFSAELGKIEPQNPRRESVVLPPDSHLADEDIVGNQHYFVPDKELMGRPESPEAYYSKLKDQNIIGEAADSLVNVMFSGVPAKPTEKVPPGVLSGRAIASVIKARKL
ncbi:hypothetical protein KY385_01620 [Candidatus Parcubacteria bacterium]|nr:hypothetical protein [Candidatus Parcubacteria bacterium]